jgi:predicted SnoaL-like aldol condensation-catalyzing enzyme
MNRWSQHFSFFSNVIGAYVMTIPSILKGYRVNRATRSSFLAAAAAFAGGAVFPMAGRAQTSPPVQGSVAVDPYIDRVVQLLKSFQTGDTRPLSFIDPTKYTQHNLRLGDGVKALADRIRAVKKGSATVETLRAFRDGNFVFTHSLYDFGVPTVGFDIFRFDNGLIVEHWDNLQKAASKPSHSMVDGPRAANDLDKTDANKALLKSYMDEIVVQNRRDRFPAYFDGNNYIQHNPLVQEDGLTGLFAGLQALAQKGITVEYDGVRMILGQGDFVLVANEAKFGGKPSAIYDMYRVSNGKIAEHWDTIEEIPPRVTWKNDNGKF